MVYCYMYAYLRTFQGPNRIFQEVLVVVVFP